MKIAMQSDNQERFDLYFIAQPHSTVVCFSVHWLPFFAHVGNM